jgi:hypothetical protein
MDLIMQRHQQQPPLKQVSLQLQLDINTSEQPQSFHVYEGFLSFTSLLKVFTQYTSALEITYCNAEFN